MHDDDDVPGLRRRVIALLAEALARHPAAAGVPVGEATRLLDSGVIDSTGLLDVVLEVEAACGLGFDPLRLDLEGGLTLGMLADAFLPLAMPAEAAAEAG